METKQVRVSEYVLKEEENGEHTLTAVVARVGVMDSQHDILEPKSVGHQKVVLSEWAHSAVYGAAPIGKGWVEEKSDTVVLKAAFFPTERGKEAYTVVKELADTVEYSIGLIPLEYTEGQDKAGKYFRKITKAEVMEVSPVLRGAMPGTHTVDVKAEEQAGTAAAETAANADVLNRWFTKHTLTLRGLRNAY